MNILWLPGYPYEKKSEIFAGLQASTKLHKSAVKRNRMRRRCREALRITLRRAQGDTQNCQLIITPRSSSLSADFAELQKDTEHFLMHLQKEQRQTLR
jgi:ribonuclease P protein component